MTHDELHRYAADCRTRFAPQDTGDVLRLFGLTDRELRDLTKGSLVQYADALELILVIMSSHFWFNTPTLVREIPVDFRAIGFDGKVYEIMQGALDGLSTVNRLRDAWRATHREGR